MRRSAAAKRGKVKTACESLRHRQSERAKVRPMFGRDCRKCVTQAAGRHSDGAEGTFL